MNEHRYILKTAELTLEQARDLRNRQIAEAEEHALHVHRELESANAAVLELRKAPLQTQRTEYVRIGPGHPDWDKADYEVNPRLYEGAWKFQTPT